MNRPRFDTYSKVILTIIAACLVGLCVDRFTARADAQTAQPKVARYNIVEAKAFLLIDGEGKDRGGMWINPEGGTDLRLLHQQNGKGQISLAVKKNGFVALVLGEDSKRPRASLGIAENGAVRLDLFSDKKQVRAGLWLTPETNDPNLVFLDDKEQVRAHLKLDKDGGPRLTLGDGKHDRAVLGVTNLEVTKTGATQQTAPSSLVLFDKEGKVIWQAPPG